MEYAIFKLKKQILDLVAQAVGSGFDFTKIEIEVPPKAEMGDLALPCFAFAKDLKKSPAEVAQDLAGKINAGGVIKEIKNFGPYLNFFIDGSVLGKQVIADIKKQKTDYGRLKLSQAKIMLEYSQPNTHKEFHIGHSRNVILGNSLVNLLKFAGYKVTPVNYIGDVGAHVAKCLWALNKFYQNKALPKNKGKFLGQVYTEASQKVEANPDYKKEADEVLRKLEAGDKKMTALWKKTRQWSLAEFDNIYKILGVKFDHVFYESEVEKPGKKMVADLLKTGVAEKSEGAVIIDLEQYGLKQFLLLKSDGSSLYSTKELALAKLKFKKYKIDKSIVVVDTRQSFYFQQFFKTMEVIGFAKEMVHIPYEFVTLKEGAMASRKGNVVLFEDFFNTVVTRAKTETGQRHKDWSEKKILATAQQVALSAIKFNMLKVGNNSVIVFDIEEALSFDGFSGPYIQYTSSRINSILKKSNYRGGDFKSAKLETEIEKELILKLASFPEVVATAVKTYEPSDIAKYLFDLARLFSTFYQKVPILNSPTEAKQARLALINAINITIKNGLSLLGIEQLRQM